MAANPKTADEEPLIITVRTLRALIGLDGPDQPLHWALHPQPHLLKLSSGSSVPDLYGRSASLQLNLLQ